MWASRSLTCSAMKPLSRFFGFNPHAGHTDLLDVLLKFEQLINWGGPAASSAGSPPIRSLLMYSETPCKAWRTFAQRSGTAQPGRAEDRADCPLGARRAM